MCTFELLQEEALTSCRSAPGGFKVAQQRTGNIIVIIIIIIIIIVISIVISISISSSISIRVLLSESGNNMWRHRAHSPPQKPSKKNSVYSIPEKPVGHTRACSGTGEKQQKTTQWAPHQTQCSFKGPEKTEFHDDNEQRGTAASTAPDAAPDADALSRRSPRVGAQGSGSEARRSGGVKHRTLKVPRVSSGPLGSSCFKKKKGSRQQSRVRSD
ncbi:hypothetical protein EYF80_032686 [Liparis tanakae]|uniref:Uncharacterized protein n=1 Tax=Liparis tanakae TaxID=230148 RepID=A0A4Z2GUQ9_9TELE|nr:hypothetical protein EYF80_032686 [Liparis tanakae]